jgi:glycosyltransferase 2 family protein
LKYLKIIKIIGVLAFLYILSLLDYKIVYESIKNLDFFYLFIYTLLWYLFFIIKVYRWHVVQNYFSRSLTFKQNFWVFLETIYLSYVTPGKIGDIARVWIIKEHFDIDKKDTMIAYTFDRVQDLFFLIICALFGLWFILDIEISNYIYIGLILFIIIYILKNKFNIVRNIQTDMNFEIKIFIINTIAFFFYFLQVYFLAKAMNLNIEYSFIVALVSISAIATLIPISIGGLGVREGVFIYLLATIGVSKEEAVILSLLDNVVFIAIFIMILHLFSKFYLKNKVGVN